MPIKKYAVSLEPADNPGNTAVMTFAANVILPPVPGDAFKPEAKIAALVVALQTADGAENGPMARSAMLGITATDVAPGSPAVALAVTAAEVNAVLTAWAASPFGLTPQDYRIPVGQAVFGVMRGASGLAPRGTSILIKESGAVPGRTFVPFVRSNQVLPDGTFGSTRVVVKKIFDNFYDIGDNLPGDTSLLGVYSRKLGTFGVPAAVVVNTVFSSLASRRR